MKRLAHISDVHFGHEDPELVAGLLEALHAAAPDLIVVSGDLTQRAKRSQFRKAKAFLDALPAVPRLVVPGNHDVSATNLFERIAHPLRRYRKFITRDLDPFLADGEVAIVGINTVRVLARKDGRINRKQVECACSHLDGVGSECVRIVVTHHPMDLPMEDTRHALVTRARRAMSRFAESGVDLFLSGHLHTAQTVSTFARYGIAGHSAIVAQAGTAVSTRTRGVPNGWNLISISMTGAQAGAGGEIVVEQRVWDGATKQFVAGDAVAFRKGVEGWERRA